MAKPLAHVKECNGEWLEHLLEDHLMKVSTLAQSLATESDQPLLDMVGRWHDLGKYQSQWQGYLKSSSGYSPDAHVEGKNRPNHSTAGATLFFSSRSVRSSLS